MTAALTPSPRHPWEELLAQLAGRMRIAHGFGTEDDAKRASIDHVTWIPGKSAREPRKFNVAGQEIVCLSAVPHTVVIRGGSPAQCFQREADLVGAIDTLAGPEGGSHETTPPRPGYAWKGGEEAIVGGGAGGSAWTLRTSVTLKLFVPRAYNPPHAVATVDVSVTALNAPDDAPTDDLNPIEASG